MKLKYPSALNLTIGLSLLFSCAPKEISDSKNRNKTHQPYSSIATTMGQSCMPCHNKDTLPLVIQKIENTDFNDIDGETRLRILHRLASLQTELSTSGQLNFTNKEALHKFYAAAPGEFYVTLEKGLMPPTWSSELMETIKWPGYLSLSWDKRIELLRYARPYSKKYIR